MDLAASELTRLPSADIAALLLTVAVLLGVARVCGEAARRLHQPAVLGEILAGILLGPTILGRLLPGFQHFLFPAAGARAVVLDSISTLSVTLFLLVAGLEVDLGRVWRQGRVALSVSVAGIVVPFGMGALAALVAPGFFGHGSAGPGEHAPSSLVFVLFFATALSISSLPVIARTLLDLNLFRTDLGMIVIAAAIFQDIIGWIIFAIVLGLMGHAGHGLPVAATIGLTLGYTAFTLTVVRVLVHRALPWIQAHATWPHGVLGFSLVLALLGAAFTEWIGVHAIFGTFLVGVAIGDSSHLRGRTRATIDQFISSVFAPLFFASVGLKVDFVARFDPPLVAAVFVLACAGKIVGAGWGAWRTGMGRSEALAIGFGMNARGAMEIVLGLLALEAGVIEEPMFVALVVMALGTSVLSGPAMQRFMGRKKQQAFKAFLPAQTFIRRLAARTPEEAIRELAKASGGPATPAHLTPEHITAAVLARERMMPSGLRDGVAVPTARLEGLPAPVVALGLSEEGLDFDAPDGEPARIVVLLLIPGHDHEAQWALLSDVARTLGEAEMRERVRDATSYVELLAALNWGDHHAGESEGPRKGVVLVGAGATARAVAKKAQALGATVRLVDTNRDHCAAAQRDGLTVLQGNALRDVVLFQVQAHQAGALVAMTANAEVNQAVTAFAAAEFKIPETLALGSTFAPGAQLEGWDAAVAGGEAAWVEVLVAQDGADPRAALAPVAGGAQTLPALAVRDGVVRFVGGAPLRRGDVVWGLRLPTRAIRSRVDQVLATCLFVDDAGSPPAAELLTRAAQSLAVRLGVPADDLIPRLADERELPLIAPWLAVKRLVLPQAGCFELAVARAAGGTTLPGAAAPVHSIFVLTGSEDERATHLHLLASLAQVLAEPDFEARWRAAPDADAARRLLVGA